jgi:hypothetical protein
MLVGCGQSEVQFYEIIEREQLTDEVMMLFSDLFQTPGAHLKEYNDMFYILLVGEEVNTGGYQLEVTEAVMDERQVSFTIAVIEPGPDVLVTEAFTYPTLILSTKEIIDKANMEIK